MKKQKTFVIRIDLESDKGICEGVPKILDLMRKYSVKGSFYLTMGGESNLIEILKYNQNMKSSSERKIKLWSLRDKIRIALFPKDFVKSNLKILKRIIDEGHELGIHGWKHRAWTRGFDKINHEQHIKKAIKRYKKLFGCFPDSFSAPGFNTNNKILEILEKNKIKYISDFSGESVKKIRGITNVPMTVCGKNKMPFIEYGVTIGKKDSEILKKFKREIKGKDFVSFYIHGMFEGRFKINLLEQIIIELNRQRFISRRIRDKI
jgi:peptidoglycan/xylan/chitin deacetylase (PgdA/CDA1 family)